MATVTYDNVTLIYPGADRPSVSDLNIEIADGEFLVLVGPSGCGKSTSLRMLAGLEEVTSGRILIDGRDVTALSPKDRDVAMVFQNYALYPHMSVADNMGFALKIAGVDKGEIRKRVEEDAQIIDLTQYLERKPKDMSGGQRQRVAIGRAIVRKPKVFLFDEPLSNLDAKLRVTMRVEIKELHRRLGTTIIYVTHDQIEAMTMADKIVVMRDGRVEQIGAPLDLYDNPRNVFVAGFIGNPPMNLLRGRLEPGSPPRVVGPGSDVAVPAQLAHAASASSGRLVVGVRPNALLPSTEPGGLEGRVAEIDPLIGETEVVLELASGPQVRALLPETLEPPEEGSVLRLKAERLTLFDAAHGGALPSQPWFWLENGRSRNPRSC